MSSAAQMYHRALAAAYADSGVPGNRLAEYLWVKAGGFNAHNYTMAEAFGPIKTNKPLSNISMMWVDYTFWMPALGHGAITITE